MFTEISLTFCALTFSQFKSLMCMDVVTCGVSTDGKFYCTLCSRPFFHTILLVLFKISWLYIYCNYKVNKLQLERYVHGISRCVGWPLLKLRLKLKKKLPQVASGCDLIRYF